MRVHAPKPCTARGCLVLRRIWGRTRERSGARVFLDLPGILPLARSWLRSLLGQGSSLHIPWVWVCFPCSSGDTLPAAPPPPPAPLLIPSRRGCPPTTAVGAMAASAERAAGESGCPGSPGDSPALCKPQGVWGSSGCSPQKFPLGCDGCWVGARAVGRPGLGCPSLGRGVPALQTRCPGTCSGCCLPGVLPVHASRACSGSQCSAGQTSARGTAAALASSCMERVSLPPASLGAWMRLLVRAQGAAEHVEVPGEKGCGGEPVK